MNVVVAKTVIAMRCVVIVHTFITNQDMDISVGVPLHLVAMSLMDKVPAQVSANKP